MPGRDRPPRLRGQGRARLVGAAGLLLGAGLLALALPVAGAALSRVPGDAVLRELRAGTAVDTPALRRFADSRRAALTWRDDPRDRAELALAALLLAERADAGRAPLLAAERALTAALRAAPADPYAWTRLALVRWRLDRPVDRVRAALDAARATGANNARLRDVQAALAARLDARVGRR
jgi:hypothetical protein